MCVKGTYDIIVGRRHRLFKRPVRNLGVFAQVRTVPDRAPLVRRNRACDHRLLATGFGPGIGAPICLRQATNRS
jgi:hypothetical protein